MIHILLSFASECLETLKKYVLDTINIVMFLTGSNLQPHNDVLPVVKGLNVFIIYSHKTAWKYKNIFYESIYFVFIYIIPMSL